MTKHVHCITSVPCCWRYPGGKPRSRPGQEAEYPLLWGMTLATGTPALQQRHDGLPDAQHRPHRQRSGRTPVLRLVRGKKGAGTPEHRRTPAPAASDLRRPGEVQQLPVAEAVERYMVVLVSATRYPERFSADLQT